MEAIGKTVELHQDSMPGENNSKDLKAAKENQQELTLHPQACEDGKGRIIEWLKTRLPLEAKAEIEVIENEIQPKLNAERSALLIQYAESLAQTNALRESLDGIWGERCHRDLLLAVGNFRDRYSDSGIDIHQKITDATASYREGTNRCRRMDRAQLPRRSRECTFLGLSGIFATASRGDQPAAESQTAMPGRRTCIFHGSL